MSHGFWTALTACSLLAVGVCFVGGADKALVYDSLKSVGREEEYGRLYEAKIFTYVAVGGSIAALAGSWIAASGGMYLLAWLQVPVYSMLLCVGCYIREIKPCTPASHDPSHPSVRALLKYVSHEHEELRWLIFYLAIILMGVTVIVNLRPMYFQLIGIPIWLFGILHVIQLVCLALAGRMAHRYAKFGRRKVLWSFGILLVGGCVFLAIVQSAWMIPILILVVTITEAIPQPIFNQRINQLVGSEVRATVLSISTLLVKLGFCLISPAVGWITEVYSLTTELFGLQRYFSVG